MDIKEISDKFYGTPHYDTWMNVLYRNATATVPMVKREPAEPGKVIAPRTKKHGGHLKYITPEAAKQIRATYIGGTVTNEDTKAVYKIVGANSIRFFYTYIGQADGDTNIPQGVVDAHSLLAHDQAFDKKVRTSNNSKWTFQKNGVSVRLDRKLASDGLFHPNMSVKLK